MVIGLTGGTGTGKTSVSKVFEDAGYEVINYDLVTRTIYSKGSDCLSEVVNAFGTDILTGSGELDRRKLGEVVFSNRKSLDILNKIVYKYIVSLTAHKIDGAKGKKLLLDAPTLFESGLNAKCDLIVGVIAQKDIRVQRVCLRDSLSPQRVEERISSQKSDDFYRDNCDFVIENNGSIEELNLQTQKILEAINSKFCN